MWPSIGTSQAPIAAALSLRKDVPADDIEKITVALSDFGYDQQRDFLGEITHARTGRSQRAVSRRPRVPRWRHQGQRLRGAPLPRPLAPWRSPTRCTLAVDKSLNGEAEILGVQDGGHQRARARHGRPRCCTRPAASGIRRTTPASRRSFCRTAEACPRPRRARTSAAEVILSVDRQHNLAELLAAVAPRRARCASCIQRD